MQYINNSPALLKHWEVLDQTQQKPDKSVPVVLKQRWTVNSSDGTENIWTYSMLTVQQSPAIV